MAYTDVDTVKGLMAQQKLDTTTNPNATQAQPIINGISAEMDSHLNSVGFTVPVVTPAYFVTFLDAVNSWGAVASILRSMFPNVTGPGEQPAYAFWEKKYQAALDDIDSRMIIPGGADLSNTVLARSYLTDNPDNDQLTDGSLESQRRVLLPGGMGAFKEF